MEAQNQPPKPASLNTRMIQLLVRTPERVVFNGEAKAVSSVNERGPFDVLPAHQNFITLIREHLTIHGEAKDSQEIPVQGGVMKVNENSVQVFLGLEALAQPDKKV